ncbi:hypothetical protein SAMN04515647_1199 [Cohaesibacter sp. ES.047]|nr:hypothetical protein SAMN04515647_1199 [Cohaesibacter sp. ES.047]
MQLDLAFVRVPDPENIILLWLQAGERQAFNGFHHVLLLRFGRFVFQREGNNT